MLEIMGMNLTDCLKSDIAGAGRVLLVSAASEGGLTPTPGLASLVSEQVITPVYCMLRTHSRSYHYELSDLEVMKRDAESLDPYCEGFYIGILNKDGLPDLETMEMVLQNTDKKIIFNRAFDEVSDPAKALRLLNRWERCEGILTSGGPGLVKEHYREIQFILKNRGQLFVTLTSGIDLDNLEDLAREHPDCSLQMGAALRGGNAIKEIDYDLLNKAVVIFENTREKK